MVPKSFLPVGDSSFIRGVLVAQEGSSPEQMHAYQTQAEKIMQANPAVRSTFTMSGNSAFLPIESGIPDCVSERSVDSVPPIRRGRRAVDGRDRTRRFPALLTFLQPNPVLEISTGATANAQGQFAYALSGIDPDAGLRHRRTS